MAEMTTGQRIAAEYAQYMDKRLPLAARIDKAIAETWEEGHVACLAEKLVQVRSPKVVDLEEQLAAKEAEAGAMRKALEDLIRLVEHLNRRDSCAVKVDMHKAALASNAGADLLARLRAAEQQRDNHKQDLDQIAKVIYPSKEEHFTYSTDFIIEEITKLRAAEEKAFTGLIRCRRCGRTSIWERKGRDIEIINECCSQAGKWREQAEKAEEKAAALEPLAERGMRNLCASCGTAIDSRWATRAKEPGK